MICSRCHHPLADDLTFNRLMALYGLPQRRMACLNSHTHMIGLEGVAEPPSAPHVKRVRRGGRTF